MIFEKIRERLQEKKQSIEQNMFGNEDDMVYLSDAIDIINKIEAEYNNGWIPCEVELPKETQKSYLIYYKRHGGLNGCYNLSFVSKDYFMSDKRWEIEDRFPDAKVTHWQPLPQPPKGD